MISPDPYQNTEHMKLWQTAQPLEGGPACSASTNFYAFSRFPTQNHETFGTFSWLHHCITRRLHVQFLPMGPLFLVRSKKCIFLTRKVALGSSTIWNDKIRCFERTPFFGKLVTYILFTKNLNFQVLTIVYCSYC